MEDVLPESVMLDVLSRLPVKAIVRFKCVCRKWRDLVSDPYFVRLHLSRSHEALMIYKCCIGTQGSLEWVEMMEHEDKYHLHPVKSLICVRGPPFSFAGSVNGLICCYRPYDSVYILNPVLKEYMILPKLQLENEMCSYGFGVSTVGEYKVILCNPTVSFVQNKVYGTDHTLVHTIGTNQWRVLGQTPNHTNSIQIGPGVFLNSHVYWLGYGQVYDFDLNTETFELFPSPSGRYRKSKLGVLKGKLSLILLGSLGLEVWVMNGKSWYKERTIQQNIRTILRSYPVCLIDGLKDTGILIVHDEATKKLLAYCLNTNATLHLNCRADFFTIMTYRPSFVKLHSFQRVDFRYDKFQGLVGHQ
ncbi:putative F-box domain, kelch-type beta propeller, F-box associated interaction [Helianthus annuus]|uniref:F-box domain, kelch-type beta propeller, F-box associated interaction n=1 Tax=Helianthus annuus TaxID=4232 RepID=A0A251V783_HELAN|nr:putative F-box domain, kelch-type beta propeller, F-box associated interaction [Helianthus annuus]KAJ0593115.1 putative F-box domain, kelch-type beta propeller, F-box associated interaction [Helianthus annuus]KAJ0600908.1 putative F-box domain, kelch-type beta propeller, F-box associated interaction [Helianthus annuus]KAJ0608126.1 putative F-box domain, kelch-type beta propeller, F-box associated interaction [Helianthus annuus]KAJ0768193.1 putative F-box domain, kelch-type beta propeller, F-